MSSSSGAPAEFDPFAGPALERTAPSTESQREIWTAVQLGADANLAFNESCSLSLEGGLDPAAMRAALADLVARHEATRTTISPDGTTLCIAAEAPLTLEVLDLTERPEAEREARVAALLEERVRTPFDLERGPLIRFDLVRTAPNRHLLVLTAHHIVCDGFSTGVLLRDLAQLYSARRLGRAPALPPAHPFSRYAEELLARQRTPEHAADERHWVSRFTGSLPVLELPTDRPRPRVKTYVARRHDRELPAALVAAVKKAGARTGASLFVTLLAALDALLHRLTGQDDLVVGIASAGQATAGHPDLVGHCVNTLPIRVAVDGAAPFAELLRAVRGAVLDAQEHAEYTFGSLIRALAVPRDASRLPLVSVLFNLDPGLAPEALAFEGAQAGFRSNPRAAENFDLFLNAVEQGGGLTLECQYNTDLFDEETVRRWFDALELLLQEVATRPETAVDRLPVLPAGDARRLEAVNDTARPWPRDRLLHELVEAQADRTPDAVAIRFGESALTYRELDARASRLAHRLRALGAAPEVLVGISLERSLDLVVALLAVHKAGAGYVPLDPAFPAERLAFMVADSGMPLIVTQRSLRAALPPHQARVVELDGEDAAAIAGEPATRLPRSGEPSATAYVLYTSGSTGKPKGVAVPVSALVNFLWSVKDEPGMGPADRLVAVTTLSFDIAGLELWLPLLTGATVVLASRDEALDGARLLGLLARSGATVMQATPATWRLLLAAGWEGAPGFRVLCGGEALPADLADALAQRGTLFNLYGPTETTIWSTCHRVSPGGPVLIGHPLANQQVHVLDGLGQRVPLGVPGELYIGGDGVSRGYLNRPDLTAERFVPDPFRGVPGARMYRTGDVVRLRADGNLEFIGRNDGQVKVRGFRIELGEIEGALARHPAVAQAVAQVRELRAGDARLVAWYVGREGATASDDQLRQHLRGILPEYMVPQHLVRLDRLPLTPNGKIDRKALPTPEASTGPAEGFVAPRTPAEERVAALWQEALGVARVGVHDDFFALGGHSLLAAQVIARLAREHGIAVPMRRMFEAPTVAAFAALLGDSRQVDIPRVPEGPSPASFMQERVWNLDALQPGRAVFHLPAAFRLRGPLDVGALEGALRAFAARHDAVRTTLRQDGNDVVQRVAPEFRCSLAPEPVPGAPGPEQEAALRQVLLAASLEPFDLEQGPLLRLRLFRLAQEEHVLFALPHHAIWDGWSFDLLVRDLDELYAAAVAGRAPRLPDLTLRYRDFAAWHRGWLQSPEVQAQADWWRGQLAGAVEPLELPADRRRTRAAGDGGDTLWVEVSRAEADALGALGQRSGATLFQVMLAAFQVVLHRWSGQSDLLVGTPVRGRSLPGLDDLVGTFVNTLLVRTSLAGRPSFSELLRRVRAAVTDAFAHEDVPFELLTMTGKPVFRALFSFQDVRARPRRLGPLALEQVHVLPPVASNDVSLWVMEKDSGLVGGFNYSTALFDRATAEGLLDGLRAVLRAAIADPGAPVDRLPLADPAGGPILDGGPVTPSPLHAPFDTLAAEAPEAPAVGAAAGTALSRRALDARARGLAGALRRAGVGPGSRVALWLDDAAELAAALLATSRLGAAAAPLDQGEPAVRLEAQLEALRPAALVGGDDAPATACPRVDPAAAGEHPDDAPAAPVDPEATALIACLDGADEAPVLIELSHRAVGAAVEAVHRAGALGPGDVLAGPATPGPARRVLEVWLALRAGARLAPIDPTTLSDGAELGRALVDAGATALVAGADAWRALREAGFTAPAGFRGFLDGESVADDLAGQLAALPGGAFAVWGAAECAFWAAVHSLGAGSPTQPAPGLRLAVLAPDLRPLPPGVVGELAVAGASVARLAGGGAGPRLERDPGAPGTAWLITGDRARLRRGGGLELLGRLDGLAQIGGRRLSPARVEEAIRAHPGVAEAAVAALEVGRGERVLVAWWAARTGAELSDSELRRHLRRRLPRHAVPQHLVEVPALPRGADGSLDRAALRSPVRGRSRGAVALRTPEEALVAEIWGAALGIADLGAEDNFFDLGGHSLLALQVIEQLARRTGRRVSPMVLLDQSLSQVAERFAAAAS